MKNYLNKVGEKMSKVDISIIVPIYNAEKYINKCVDSLLRQTKEEIEFILINDGSTDNTDNLLREYIDSIYQEYSDVNTISKKLQELAKMILKISEELGVNEGNELVVQTEKLKIKYLLYKIRIRAKTGSWRSFH